MDNAARKGTFRACSLTSVLPSFPLCCQQELEEEVHDKKEEEPPGRLSKGFSEILEGCDCEAVCLMDSFSRVGSLSELLAYDSPGESKDCRTFSTGSRSYQETLSGDEEADAGAPYRHASSHTP